MSTLLKSGGALDAGPRGSGRTTSPRARAAAAAILSLVLGGCSKSRDLSLCAALSGSQSADCNGGTGEHPAGWGDTTNQSSPNFHASWIKANINTLLYKGTLAQCQTCHGTDYTGGGVGVSCLTSGCHTKPGGPEYCGTCHGDPSDAMLGLPVALPSTGAHGLHSSFCNDCHDVPKTVAQADHITGAPKITFSGLAVTGGATPTYDPSAMTCANVYCHVSQTPTWQAPPATIACNLCHQTPPATHQAWGRVANPPAGASPTAVAAVCSTCHPAPTPGAKPAPGDTHVNGQVDFNASIACDTCHGHDATGAPPVALDGSTTPSSPGVGQHAAHLDDNFTGRIGHVVDCSTCHTVPASVTQPGHLDHPLPATVSLPQGGTFDPATQSCTVWCHWGPNAGIDSAGGIKLPTWTDTSGAILSSTCTSCHGFPPVLRRDGTPHTHAPSALSACLQCHPFSVATHVDGLVELLP